MLHLDKSGSIGYTLIPMMKGQARTSLSLGWNIYHREYPVQQLMYWKEPLIVIA